MRKQKLPVYTFTRRERPSDGGSAQMKRWQCINAVGILTVECSDDEVRVRFVYDAGELPVQIRLHLDNMHGVSENICEG